jgi:hypothetical protein
MYVGANGLIGATSTPLGDFSLGDILGIFSKKSLKLFKNLFALFVKLCVENLPKNVIFKVFQVHLQLLLLLKVMVTSFFTLLLKVQMLMK